MKGCRKIIKGGIRKGTMNCGDIWGSWKEDIKTKEMIWTDDNELTYCTDCLKEN